MSARALLDEEEPGAVRARIGELLAAAARADFAVSRIRLAALDLTAAEVSRVRRCRVLLGQLDAGTLLDAVEPRPRLDRSGAPTAAAMATRLEVLLAFGRSGRLEVRSAGLGGWTPDFSVIDGAALLGAHYFGAPYPVAGPSFTAVIDEPDAVRRMRRRFGALWDLGHDVLPAILDVLERARALALEAAGRGGGGDRPGPPA